MKRQLNEQEKESTIKGIDRLTKEIVDIKENIEYNKDILKKNKEQRDFDDKWRIYLRKQRDKEDEEILKVLMENLQLKEDSLKSMKEHIKHGVEVKQPIGV